MRLLVDHKQTLNAYLEEVQSLAEAYSKAFSCNNLFFYIEMVGRMPHFSMKQPRPLSNHLKHLKMWYTELKKPQSHHLFRNKPGSFAAISNKAKKNRENKLFFGGRELNVNATQ